MSVVKKIFLVSLFVITVGTSCFAQESTILKADSLLNHFLKEKHVAGMAVIVTVNGQIAFDKGYGYANMASKKPVQTDATLFRVGSISKPFTTAALARLIEQKQIHPDSAVQKYVADFPEKRWSFSVRQLAGHQAGIRGYLNDEFYSNTHYNSVKEALSMFEGDSLRFEPGTDYLYSSYGYNLLSYVIEVVAQEAFIPHLNRTVFRPLEMLSTVPNDNTKALGERATFYDYENDKHKISKEVDLSNKWAGGGFLSTASDVSKFALAHSRPGFFRQYLLSMLQTPRVTLKGESTDYGMGWTNRKDNQGNTVIGHSGGSIGGTCQMVIYPDYGVTVVILTNQSFVNFGGIQFTLGQLFLEGETP